MRFSFSKKAVLRYAPLLLCTLLLLGASAGAVSGTPGSAVRSVTAEIRGDFTVVIDGTVQNFTDVNGQVVYPMLYNGTTYLPVRAIGNLMGKSVDWNNGTKTITLTGTGGSLVTDADTFSGGTTPIFTDANGAPMPTIIAKEKARDIALEKVPGADETHVVKLKTDIEHGKPIYEVEIVYSGMEYEFEIDAATGTILKLESEWDH